MDFDFLRRKGETYALVASTKTDEDGRTAKPLMAGEAFRSVSDRIVFHVAADDRHLHLRAEKRALRLPLHHRNARARTRWDPAGFRTPARPFAGREPEAALDEIAAIIRMRWERRIAAGPRSASAPTKRRACIRSPDRGPIRCDRTHADRSRGPKKMHYRAAFSPAP